MFSKGHRNPLAALHSLNFLKYGKEAFSLNIFYMVILFLCKGNFDIIQCHFGPNGIIGALLKELGIKSKVVTTFHGYDLCKFVKRNGEDIYQDLFQKGDLFLPISDFWKNRLIQLGCPQEKIVVHHMGIDTKKFLFHPRTLSIGQVVNILTIARLTEKKGLEYSIKAVAKTMNKYPNIKYDIVGDGPLMGELSSLIHSSGLVNRIRLLGWKVGKELQLLLENTHLFLLHSIEASDGDMEGIPVSLMEALAAGIPVISTFHSGIPELIQNGKSGFLVSEKDVGTTAEKLEYLINNPNIWPEMGRTGRRDIEERFEINRLNQKLVDIYQTLIS